MKERRPMTKIKLCLIRPPALPAYQDTDIKEDPMLTALLGYLKSINFPTSDISVFDFQLDRSLNYQNLIHQPYDHYVITARDLGESYRYSLRVAEKLSTDTTAKIWLYGQVAPLRHLGPLPKNVTIVNQSEQELAEQLGIDNTGAKFEEDLRYISYFDLINLESWQSSRRKGAIETTRGCPYKCTFCFISAGQNYSKRWLVRPIDNIMQDLHSYVNQGIDTFVFLDSEFLGANVSYHKQKALLLQRIISELPPITYMILCRADTLLQFNQFELLKKSGFKKILLGVESLYQPDLDALRKDSTVAIMMEAIIKLIENEVECCLTYLTFHRNTSLKGLRENLRNIETLYNHKNARYLGMPNFSFNMEVIRGDYQQEGLKELTNLTYIKPLLEARTQKNVQACFPTELEPLIEIYRLLQYEWVQKKCELIRVKHTMGENDNDRINQWFDGLGKFCISIMIQFLNSFEQGLLNFNTLFEYKEMLFNYYKEYYTDTLPKTLQTFATYESHAKSINYQNQLIMEDHGWDSIIPA